MRYVLGFGTRAMVAFCFVLLWLTTRRVARQNGVLFGRLGTAWLCLATLYLLRAIGDLEAAADFLPGVNLLQIMYDWLWLPTGVVALALARFLEALNQEHPKGAGRGT